MKKDLKILIDYLDQFITSFHHSQMYLNGEKEDAKMIDKISEIAKKNKIDFN